MASTSETGHVVNIANFRKIIDLCEEFGETYDPVNADISIASMTAKWTAVNVLHGEYIVALEGTKIPINDRELLFQEISRVAVRTVNLYASTKASKLAIKDAKGFVIRFTGRNVKIPKLEDGTPDPKYVSNSQQSYVKKTEHFEKLIELYKADSNYASNEELLQVANLETLLANAKSANQNVHDVVATAIKKRIDRDHALYDIGTGLYDLSMACKKYVRGLFGPKSPEAMSVVSIKLKRNFKLYPV